MADVVAVEDVRVVARVCSSASTKFAIVDLPAPDSPVSHSTVGRCRSASARSCLPTVRACQRTFCERRRAKWISPAPTVLLVSRSTSRNPPVSRFSLVGVEGDRVAQLEVADADLVELELRCGHSARDESMLSLYFSGATVAGTVR